LVRYGNIDAMIVFLANLESNSRRGEEECARVCVQGVGKVVILGVLSGDTLVML
jgi:hypothetical protein